MNKFYSGEYIDPLDVLKEIADCVSEEGVLNSHCDECGRPIYFNSIKGSEIKSIIEKIEIQRLCND